MIIQCGSCNTKYRFDQNRIPESGLNVRCTRCGSVFRATRSGAKADAPPASPQDAEIRRLARVVVSDIELYNPDVVEQAFLNGRFADEFRAEMEEARRMVKGRFPGIPGSTSRFDQAVEDICAQRRDKASAG